MNKCENCRLRKESAIAFDIHWHDEDDCPYAHCPVPDFPQTNYDRLISKTPEELATFFGTLPCCPPGNADELCFPDNTCGADTKMMIKCWANWLKAPVEEVDQ